MRCDKLKLYRIIELHAGPKDIVTFTRGYVVKENDEQVFNHIVERHNSIMWGQDEDIEEHIYGCETYDEFKKYIIENKGDLEEEDGFEDAYYGVSKYGWEYVADITKYEFEVLSKFGVIEGDER